MSEETLKDRVARIKVKVGMLLSRYESERQQRIDTQKRVKELEDELRRLKGINERLSLELESLKVANVLTPDHRDVESTRAFLSGLVREIDKCITFLSH